MQMPTTLQVFDQISKRLVAFWNVIITQWSINGLENVNIVLFKDMSMMNIALVDDVKLVLDSLAKLITTTKLKSVFNLGVCAYLFNS